MAPRNTASTDRLREAFLVRGHRTLDRVAEHATPDEIQEALEAPTEIGGLARLLARQAAGDAAIAEVDPLAEAVLRSVEVKQRLLEGAGGALEASQVADLLRISRQAVNQRRNRGRLLGVPAGSRFLYPACQFTETGVVPHLGEALEAFEDVNDPWTRLSVLLSGEDVLEGETVIGALRRGRVEDALAEIRRFGEM
jgi:hypothetical protein